MKKITLRKSDIRDVNKKIEDTYGVEDFFSKKDKIELVDEDIILHNDIPAFFYHEGKISPTLKLLLKHEFPIKKVTVDMGAVKFVVSGADIMRPGITDFGKDIEKDDLVAIVDQNNHKPMAIGQMLFSGAEAEAMTSGKVVKSVHYVGDALWTQ
ncbi:DUF1947 domain-containing protein [Thermoproteota archaeon]